MFSFGSDAVVKGKGVGLEWGATVTNGSGPCNNYCSFVPYGGVMDKLSNL